jgi:ketosteroid isomerase-like protein
MSAENVELVRRTLERFVETGEVEWEAMHEKLEIHDHDIPEHGDYYGRAGFIRWLSDWGEAWSEWNLEVEEVLDAGDQVVAVIHLTAKGAASGITVDRHDSLVYGFRDGKVARTDYFNSRQQGLERAGLAHPA